MQYAIQQKPRPIAPRIIIHGGAGNITRENLPPSSYKQYRHGLLDVLQRASIELQKPNATALDVATYAVSLLEKNPLFNAGHGAVYTRDGTHELEASIMVSRGYIKRGVGVMQVKHVKSPISLARELLVRGELENGGGGQGHCQLTGETCDRLAREWELEMVQPSYYWTRKRWDEHRRGLGLEHDDSTYERHRREADNDGSHSADPDSKADAHIVQDPSWDGKEYLPQGTVGTVVLDSSGTLCVCTSTGGLTNKLPGRIGDTPTLGAGFWAEQWYENENIVSTPTTFTVSWLADCLPTLTNYSVLSTDAHDECASRPKLRAAAISGTGNGDSFLRINAVRTAVAIARYSGAATSLQSAVTAVAGLCGQLEQSAGSRWHKTGEGEGGMIGIELKDERGHVVYDHNCGGMFRAWIDDYGELRFGVFQDEKNVPIQA